MRSPLSPAQTERIRRYLGELLDLHDDERMQRLEAIRESDADLGQELEALVTVAESLPGDSEEKIDRLLATGPAEEEVEENLTGRRISHFKIGEWLGSGEMGVVYRAEDVNLGRTVALKFLPRHLRLDEKARARFVQEARAASRLDHRNVCTVFEVDQASDGRTFIAMPCYEGETLEALLAREDLSVERAVDYARQILMGLGAAHDAGIVHRDVKPSNLFVTTDGTVKILDFGIAKLAATDITRTGAVVGTAAYMSPEQARGDPADARTDLWSFGAVLYEMLSGRKPFSGAYALAVMYAIMHVEPEPLPDHIPEHVRRVVERCLAKDRDARFDRASEAAEALDGAAPPHVPQRQSLQQRIPWLAPAAVVLIITLALGVTVTPAGSSMLQRIQTIVGMDAETDMVRHLVVLPFSSYGGDENRDAIAEGLFQILTSTISQIDTPEDSLWVVPASDVTELGVRSVEKARDAFGIKLAITGSMHWSGDDVQLTLNLVDAASLRQMGSEIMYANADDIRSLQDQVSDAVAAMIGIEPGLARDVFEAGDSSVPGAYEFFVSGKGYLQQYDREENLDSAIDLLQRATDLDPQFALAHAALAEAYWRMYDLKKDPQLVEPAVAHGDTASTLGENLIGVQIAVGMVQLGLGRYEEAQQTLSRAVRLDEQNADAHRELGRAYERLATVRDPERNIQRAESHLERAIALRPAYWAGHHYLGVVYFRSGRYEEAATRFGHVVTLAPRNPRPYAYLGSIYALLGRRADALDAFESALELQPEYRTYLNLGTLYYYLEHDFAGAAELYERAISENDSDYRIWGALGEAYYWSGSAREKARSAFSAAIERAEAERSINPRDAMTTAQVAVYHAYQGETERAVRTIEEVLEEVEEDGDVYAHAAEVHAMAGDAERAGYFVERALESGFDPFYIERSPLLAEFARGDLGVLFDER